ncbi:MAG TPA: copper homeostasis protein CutC [Paludibacter sp.]|nr:copper homeostasis protein CutC [Paludibacter sp.]
MYTFEICANSVKSCLAAQEGGAHRVELCTAIPEGGTTPSFGEIAIAREMLQIKLHVIIRPRSGDFLYSSLEIKSMLKDIEMCKKLNVDGVVFGVLNSTGDINIPAMNELMAASKGMSVTFHRAFDMCHDPHASLEQIINLGCDRLLTSGQRSTAEEGIPLLKKLNEQAGNRIILLAGSGVNETNIQRIASETDISEFHFSAREKQESQMTYRNHIVSMGGTVHIDEYENAFTSPGKVKSIIDALLYA